MAVRKSKPSNPGTPAAQVASAPYDPLDLKTLAESMARVVLEQPVHQQAKVPAFEGAGIYVIYYTGDYEPYKSITQRYQDGRPR
jgi:hypothetical protein